MKKQIKVSGIAFLLLCSLFIFIPKVVAAENSLSKIDIHVQLLEDGSAKVTEHREMDMQEGTELYIVLNNLQNSDLLDFSVDGFQEKSDWDSDDSREEKTGYYGVLYKSNSYELVWGIGDYGQNQYDLTYTLSNLVRNLEDGQGLLWNFDTFSQIPPENLTMTIEGPTPFTSENTKIWGFGLEGDIELEQGKIIWQSKEALERKNYATVLAQFPKNMFQTIATEDMTLEEQQEMAQRGSAYNQTGSILSKKAVAWIIGIVVAIVGVVIFVIIRIQSAYKNVEQFESRGKLKKRNKDLLFDQVPYEDGDIADIAFLVQRSYIGFFEQYFFAYLLKWAKEGRIRIETTDSQSKKSKKDQTLIRLLAVERNETALNLTLDDYVDYLIANQNEQAYETAVWRILVEAADGQDLITEKQIKKWSEKHGEEMDELGKKLKDYSLAQLERKGYLTVTEAKVFGIKFPIVSPTEKGNDLANRLTQFENYLKQIDLKEAATYEQNMDWEDLLIWLAIYGKAETIVKQLKKFYPEVWDSWSQENPYFYGGFYGYHGFYSSWSSGFDNSGYNSSGSGGSTSVGGGGGAGGGGGGGAR